MNFRPVFISVTTDESFSGAAERSRWMEMEEIIAAEMTKLKLSSQKQGLAPNQATNWVVAAGPMICIPCIAWDIKPLALKSPLRGTMARSATDCAGMKKLETAPSANRIA